MNYKLHFTRFYEDEIIATIFHDCGAFYADFEIEDTYESDEPYDLYAETIEEAKLEVEEKIAALFLVLWPIFFIVELIREAFMFLERIFRCES